MSSALAVRHGAGPDLIGSQRPRLFSVPHYARTSGPDAVELARIAGQPMDDWQSYILTEALGERANGTWAAFETCVIVPRQNGKGGIIEALVTAGLSLFDSELILYSSHEFKTSMETFRRVLNLVESTPSLAKRKTRVVRSTNELGIEFRGGQRLRFVARSSGSGRGFSGDCVILDEAYNLDDRAMDALLPTMSARPNPQLWYLSSAGMPTSVQLGRVRRRALAGDPNLAFFEWSIRARQLGDEVDDPHDDPAMWAQANPALGIRISLDYIARERAAMSAEGFARERLGVGTYPADDADGWEVVPHAAWEECADPGSTMVDPVAFSLDTTPDRSWTSIAAAGRRADELTHLEVVEHQPGTDWAAARAAELVSRWRPCAFAVDESGPAASLIPALERAGVEVVKLSGRDVAAGCGHLLDLVASRQVRHLRQTELSEALRGARKRDIGDKSWAWARRGIDVVISPLVAATQAAYAFETHSSGTQQFFGAWR